MNYIVYILFHEHKITPTNIDIMYCGIFDSEESAISAIDLLKLSPGFNETPNCFKIVRFRLDKTHWEEGFSSLIGESTLPESDEFFDSAQPLKELNLKDVYLLTHFFDFELNNGKYHDECRYIGVYSTEENMLESMKRLSLKDGFKEYKEAFGDVGVEVNKVEWTCGYFTTD
ncbi:MAG: hypothetical protein KBB37_09795 [Bacteroidia bacterium]|nr:hypothetical protein [Bacteroidia bacterium]MBP7261566.1 hypothetical protein [Bacteroidia bacterium]MBP9181103.1 hypothetical protein [Bacteroidia bacterium]MBP9724601.1 hypothetical protein [Bacteroidia bacterium]